jgi:hypothetical protein
MLHLHPKEQPMRASPSAQGSQNRKERKRREKNEIVIYQSPLFISKASCGIY